MTDSPFILGDPSIFMAPVGTDPESLFDLDSEWELVYPTCPPSPLPLTQGSEGAGR